MAESELQFIEEKAAEHLLEIEKEEFADLEAPEKGVSELDIDYDVPAGRLGAVVVFAGLAASTMIGGIFAGVTPRIYASVAVGLGVAAAIQVRRIKNPIVMNFAMIGSILLVGLICNIPKGQIGDLLSPAPFIREAIQSGDAIRPPVEYTLGWGFIVTWLMAALSFASAWIAIELKKPALGMLVPLPLVAFGAISVAGRETQVATGLACLVFFAIALGILSGVDTGPDAEQRSLAFELRRAARAFPMIAVITGLLFLAAQTDFLFPEPLFDPTQSAQKPKTVPISEVPDRVLFTVESSVTGPWRMGSLDVYDATDDSWKLPPFAENRIAPIPETGLIDSELKAGTKAQFVIKGLDGAVLPGLPNVVGMVGTGFLAYDARTGNIRLSQGTVQEGIEYIVTAASVPAVSELQAIDAPVPEKISGVDSAGFLEIPDAPPNVVKLINEAPKTSKWDELDYIRRKFLDTVVAEGAGTPVAVPVSKVDKMVSGEESGTPYEIVAAQAMLARWVGVPSRIGYGYDGGDQVAGKYEVRPKHGASFLEVWFPRYKWLPIIGNPKSAKTSFAEQTQQNSQIAASDDLAVELFIPFETDPGSFLFKQIREAVLIVLPFFIFGFLAYLIYPILRKALLKARRRQWVLEHGPAARVSLAYAEWRDLCTDFGYRHDSDTPLMFLEQVIPDEEHTQLAWLVTRAVSNDLERSLDASDAIAAEELSKSLRRRMSQAHTFTLRAVAAASRLSLRHPYAPSLVEATRKERTRGRGRRSAA